MITEKDCPFCDIEQMLDKVQLHNGSAFIIEPLNPVTPGHLLVVPKSHVSPQYGAEHLAECLHLLQEYRECDDEVLDQDFNLIVNAGENASQSIEHMHLHYVPRRKNDGLKLPWTDQKTSTPRDVRCRHCQEIIVEVSSKWYQGQLNEYQQTFWVHAYSGRTGCANFPEATP